MNKAKRPCAEVGCNNLTRNAYCETHYKSKQELNSDYNKYKRDPKTDGFYKTVAWRKARALAMERDNHLCQRCKRHKILRPAQMVHHKIEVKEDWSKRLDLDNLESLCHFCHNQIHKS
ncbi:HNH endonuclease [Virgibacillus ndiopensis]|uniref:HNH endonuclease n=1 Tax=Virgibacillus ndiopensis TaxID=2004408 RepID=UPI000C077CBA|nr:HNH endonuclease signature motif containing protein [Virgibacillus ndiopensis]